VSSDRSISKRRFAIVNWGLFGLTQVCVVIGLALDVSMPGFIAGGFQLSCLTGILIQKCWIK